MASVRSRASTTFLPSFTIGWMPRKMGSSGVRSERRYALSDIHYLNVDLDLESKLPLGPIVEEFGDDVHVLHESTARELCLASFEAPCGFSGDAEGAINYLCTQVENLPSDARRLWDQCCTR